MSDLDAARAFLQARFECNESTIFIAHQGDTAIGFAQLYPSFSSVSLARTFILNDLYVSEPHRKKGAGTQLLAAAVEFGKSSGAIRLTLSTATDNTSAQALYQEAGWERDQQFHVYHYKL